MEIYKQIEENKRNSWLLSILFFVIMFILGSIISEIIGLGTRGTIFIMILTLIYTGAMYYFLGNEMILSINGAHEVKKTDYLYLFNTVEGLSIAAGIPMPKIYVIKDPSPNAFATGRDPQHSSIAVTTGLLEKLNRLELEGVIAHELSHIKNFDIRYTLIVISMIGAIGILAGVASRMGRFGKGMGKGGKGAGPLIIIAVILGIVAPIVAQLIKYAISRKREYLADASGALLTRYPKGLADALRKISLAEPMKSPDKTSASLYISNPFGEKSLNNLLSTHPPIEERIKALEKM
ncbi:MAG: zinc metalloprotease HtpX [Candidatus Altiarchaeales archaeon HGW-Altiarchaeales-1]|nr:MAG: zinc metalloprotease HtpX [Candidatus Altiarchaeales archaeon HGW-Altiarchaeales-1]